LRAIEIAIAIGAIAIAIAIMAQASLMDETRPPRSTCGRANSRVPASTGPGALPVKRSAGSPTNNAVSRSPAGSLATI